MSPATTALARVLEKFSVDESPSRDGPRNQNTPSSTLSSLLDSCAQRLNATPRSPRTAPAPRGGELAWVGPVLRSSDVSPGVVVTVLCGPVQKS